MEKVTHSFALKEAQITTTELGYFFINSSKQLLQSLSLF